MAAQRDPRVRSSAERLFARSKSRGLRIFIFGKTGVGKSSLINTLLGKNIAEEGDSIYSQTQKVAAYTENRSITTVQSTIKDVDITLWDSPGLKDPNTDEEQTLRDIQENCGDVDMFVYCTSLTQQRIGQDDFDSIENLTRVIGDDLWKNALIALTFANELHPPPLSAMSKEEYFQKRVSDWREALRSAVIKSGVNKKDAEMIPVVPTGYRNLPLPGAPKDGWFFAFWSECLRRARFVSLPAILYVNRPELLESQVTTNAITVRIVAQLRALGDQIEGEILNDILGGDHRVLFQEPETFTAVLIDVIHSSSTDRANYVYYGTTVLLVLSIAIAIAYVANRR